MACTDGRISLTDVAYFTPPGVGGAGNVALGPAAVALGPADGATSAGAASAKPGAALGEGNPRGRP